MALAAGAMRLLALLLRSCISITQAAIGAAGAAGRRGTLWRSTLAHAFEMQCCVTFMVHSRTFEHLFWEALPPKANVTDPSLSPTCHTSKQHAGRVSLYYAT
jgi:hypothetical protein